ncbi:MAG TPA: hypothetical protein PKN53_08195 [Bacteroidales bacterium]|nr:hypothetical protein [Bacteroidales bacterium]
MKIIRKIFILIIFNLTSLFVFSQSIKNVHSEIKGNQVIVYYSVLGLRYFQTLKTSLYVSMDGGKTYLGPLKAVSGDLEIITNGNKQIVWDVFKDVDKLEGDIVFDVRAEVIEKEREKNWFLSYSGSYYSPYGLQFGQLGKIGWYVSARANSNILKKANYNCNSEGIIDYTGEGYYVFDDKEYLKCYSITAGLTSQWHWNFYWYLGAGYGKNILLWHINEYSYPNYEKTSTYVKNLDYSYTGVEVETGFIFKIKNKILISVGVANLNFIKDLTEFEFGLGYNF